MNKSFLTKTNKLENVIKGMGIKITRKYFQM